MGFNCCSKPNARQSKAALPLDGSDDKATVKQGAKSRALQPVDKQDAKSPTTTASDSGSDKKIKVLVLYYSSYGHIEMMASAVAEGVREVKDVEVVIKRIKETMPEDVARSQHYKLDQAAPIADPKELADYDAIIFGIPTRFGTMPFQIKDFIDQTGGLWLNGQLIGKVASVFTSTGTQHGGHEVTIFTSIPPLIHHGMVVVGLPYSFQGNSEMKEISGNGPFGASTLAGPDGSRQPTENELNGARFQGRHVADVTRSLVLGRSEL